GRRVGQPTRAHRGDRQRQGRRRRRPAGYEAMSEPSADAAKAVAASAGTASADPASADPASRKAAIEADIVATRAELAQTADARTGVGASSLVVAVSLLAAARLGLRRLLRAQRRGGFGLLGSASGLRF